MDLIGTATPADAAAYASASSCNGTATTAGNATYASTEGTCCAT